MYSVMQAYGHELEEAYEWCNKYRVSRKEAELHQAWDLYYHVFKRINKQLPSLTVLEVQYVAPALVRAQVCTCMCVCMSAGLELAEARMWGRDPPLPLPPLRLQPSIQPPFVLSMAVCLAARGGGTHIARTLFDVGDSVLACAHVRANHASVCTITYAC